MGQEKKNAGVTLLVLVMLTFQATGFFLVTRYSQGILKEKYSKGVCICCSEILKLLFSTLLIFLTQRSKKRRENENVNLDERVGNKGSMIPHYIRVFKNSYVLLPPALGYFLQNFLGYVSLKNLRAAYFSIINQLKILTTAFFSVTILRRNVTAQKWGGLVILLVGVVLVNYKGTSSDDTESNLLGYSTALLITISSGLSGTYIEKFVKAAGHTKEFDIWDRNLQLSLFSIVFAIASVVIFEWNSIMEGGFNPFRGFSLYAWLSVFLQGLGGMLVALVIKYSNNIIKGFSISVAIILSSVFGYLFWGLQITGLFSVGVCLVIVSIFVYSIPIAFLQIKEKKKD